MSTKNNKNAGGDHSGENPESIERILLDLAWRRFSEVWQDKSDIENKASTLLAANGVLLGLIINALKSLNLSISLAASLFLFGSIFLCVMTLKPRKYRTFGLKDTWCDLREEGFLDNNSNPEQLKVRIYKALAAKEEYNAGQLEKIAWYLMFATWLFLIGTGILVIGVVLFFV